jgi:lipopolysaccharide transport system ATP-binding protein
MTYACRVQGLGKRYRVSRGRPRAYYGYRTLQEELIRLATAPWRRLRDPASVDQHEDFWALRDIEIEIQPGEAVGIIGRNGAGKSTLLKILSRITKPTTGQVELRGRVGSLLEVGTGFHPELSGRENIYLNGAVLGMTRREIDRKFDEIVAFAEVEQFLDTPVKRYSSGMYVRLAFAVAAHLEPEILIVDEVLAVGDHEFQNKCLGKMGEVVKSGRTVLFVSHNLDAVARLTNRCLLLSRGRMVADGRSLDVIKSYLGEVANSRSLYRPEISSDQQKVVTFTGISTIDMTGGESSHFNADEQFQILIEFQVSKSVRAQIAFRLISSDTGQVIFTSGHADSLRVKCTHWEPGDYRLRCLIPPHLLAPGPYHLQMAANRPEGGQFDLVEPVCPWEITPVGSLTNIGAPWGRMGIIVPLLEWQDGSVTRETENG